MVIATAGLTQRGGTSRWTLGLPTGAEGPGGKPYFCCRSNTDATCTADHCPVCCRDAASAGARRDGPRPGGGSGSRGVNFNLCL